MKVVYSRQNDRPLYITDAKDNILVDMENNHIEMKLEDGSIFILPSVDCYYQFIGDANFAFGNKEVFVDKLFTDNYKISLANYELEDGSVVSFVCETTYNEEPVYLLKFN